MSTARQRRGLAGVSKLRRTLRRLEPEATAGIRDALERAAQTMHFDMLSTIPKDSGETAQHLSYKVSRDGLTARIGFIGKKDVEDGYVARFIEYGTKGYPKRNIPAQPARPFMAPAFDKSKGRVAKEISDEIGKLLAKLASGPDDE